MEHEAFGVVVTVTVTTPLWTGCCGCSRMCTGIEDAGVGVGVEAAKAGTTPNMMKSNATTKPRRMKGLLSVNLRVPVRRLRSLPGSFFTAGVLPTRVFQFFIQYITGITIYRLARGKVLEERGEEDALGLLRQLGVIPA
jgi:hypothetical protein